MNIDKYKELPAAVKKILAENNAADLRVGDIFIGGKYDKSKIVRIREIDYVKKSKTNSEEYVKIYYDQADDWQNDRWSQYGSSYPEEFVAEYQKLTKPIAEHLQEAMDVIEGKKSIDSFRDNSSDTINESTALIHKNSKEGLIAIQNGLEEKRKTVELVARFVGYEMERKKRALEKIRQEMYGIVAQFQKKIERIMRVVTTIELYLGIDEEIFQLQDGPAADEKVPISFRQALLYMDEETGHWQGGGLDFTNIDWFDEWLIKDNNFKKLLPEQKGVVVFRPRRKDKDYGDDRDAEIKNIANRVTYFLIRNGENLYRIYTEKILVKNRLFPRRAELEDLLKKIESEQWESRKEEQKEKIEDLTYAYRKRAMLLQGLIDRTDIFKPMPERISIFNMEATPGMINFIYDDEASLPSGRLSFDDWKKQINEKITEGSRVLITGHLSLHKDYRYARFYNTYRKGNEPALPRQGVYTVEGFRKTNTEWMRTKDYNKLVKKYPDGIILEGEGYYKRHDTYKLLQKKNDYYLNGEVNGVYVKYQGDRDAYQVIFEQAEPELTIKYLPNDKARSGWGDYMGHDRKNKIRFRIYNDDDFILNYDQIDLDDIEFYLTNRVDRPNYLYMMPVLEKIKQERLVELKNEKDFMYFIAGRNKGKIQGCDDINLSRRIVESVIWWKYKNKWKRPITKDDTLALRMIEQRINSKNYHKLKKSY